MDLPGLVSQNQELLGLCGKWKGREALFVARPPRLSRAALESFLSSFCTPKSSFDKLLKISTSFKVVPGADYKEKLAQKLVRARLRSSWLLEK